MARHSSPRSCNASASRKPAQLSAVLGRSNPQSLFATGERSSRFTTSRLRSRPPSERTRSEGSGNGGTTDGTSTNGAGFLQLLLVSLFCNINHLPLRLPSFTVMRNLNTIPGYVSKILRHYSSQIIRAVVSLIFALDICGGLSEAVGELARLLMMPTTF